MKTPSLVRKKDKLDHLFDLVRNIQDIRLQAEMSRYLCILVSGFLETSVQDIYTDYVRQRASREVSAYVNGTFRGNRSRNINANELLQLVQSFSKDWHEDLKDFLSKEGRKEALDAVVSLRNSISHGGNLSVTFHNIKEYYKKIVQIVEFLEQQCN